MVDAVVLFDQETGTPTSSSTTFVDAAVIPAASFEASTEYIILAVFAGSHASAANETRARIIHGSTVFDDAALAWEGLNATQSHQVQWMRRFTQPSTTEDVKVQFSSSSSSTVTHKYSSILAFKVADLGTENTDWFWNEDTTNYTMTGTPTAKASETFTPNGTDRWLVIAEQTYDVVGITTQIGHELHDGTSVLASTSHEGEDGTNDFCSHMLVWAGVPSNSSKTYSVRPFNSGSAVALSNRIFALNLSRFTDKTSFFDNTELAYDGSGYDNVATLSITPTNTGDFIIITGAISDIGGTSNEFSFRQQVDDGGGLVDDLADSGLPGVNNWDATDETNWYYLKKRSLTSGASRTINLDFGVTAGDGTLRLEDRVVVAFSIALAGGGSSLDRTASDALTLSDSATRVIARTRTVSDSIGRSDAATRALILSRSVSDVRSQSDAATRALVLSRTVSDATTLADVATSVKAILRTVADALGFSGGGNIDSIGGSTGTQPGENQTTLTASSMPAHSAGDRLVAVIAWKPNNGIDRTVSTPPSGWTLEVEAGPAALDGLNQQRLLVYSKAAASGSETFSLVVSGVIHWSDIHIWKLPPCVRLAHSDAIATDSVSDTNYDVPAVSTGAITGAAVLTAAVSQAGNVALSVITSPTQDANRGGGNHAWAPYFAMISSWDLFTGTDPAATTGVISGANKSLSVRVVFVPEGAGDVATRVVQLFRTAGDSISRSDSAVRTLSLFRTVADALNLADAATASKTFLRSVSDSLGLSDVATRTAVLTRSASDAIGRSDVATKVISAFRTGTDALGLADVATRMVSLFRMAADSITRSDVATRVVSFVRTTTDSLSLSDVATRVGTFFRTAADALSLADAVVAQKTGQVVRTVTDALSLSDTATRAVVLTRTTSDSITRSDAAVRLLSLFRTASDSVTLADVATRIKSTARTVSDSITRSDVVTRTVVLFRTTADSLNLSDSAIAAKAGQIFRTAADALNLSDLATRTGTFFRTTSDSSGRSDVATRVVSAVRTTADSITQSDVATRIVTLFRTAVDSISRSDVATRTISISRTTADSLGITDVATQFRDLVRSVADSITAADVATRTGTFFRTVVDSLTLTEVSSRAIAGIATRMRWIHQSGLAGVKKRGWPGMQSGFGSTHKDEGN